MDKIIDTQHFSDEIFNKLYPLLEREFEVLKNTTDWQEHCDLSNLVEEWQREFYSLSYYEKKLVFPCLLDNISKNQLPGTGQNIEEIERLTSQKEKRILLLCERAENLAMNCGLPEKHPIFGLVFLFQNSFCEVKGKWHAYLKEISVHKVCPSGEK